jgi:hypothetical protein
MRLVITMLFPELMKELSNALFKKGLVAILMLHPSPFIPFTFTLHPLYPSYPSPFIPFILFTFTLHPSSFSPSPFILHPCNISMQVEQPHFFVKTIIQIIFIKTLKNQSPKQCKEK